MFMFSKTTAIVASLLPLSVFASGSNLPEFISADDLKNPVFECLNASDATEAYTPAERKLIDQLWDETLTYLRAYAQAVTTDTRPAGAEIPTLLFMKQLTASNLFALRIVVIYSWL